MQKQLAQGTDNNNFFIRVTLLSLSGRPQDNRTFKVVLLKGVQIVASTKFHWKMEEGVLDFESTNLDFPILNYNSKRFSNAELSIVLYELQEQDPNLEDEIGCINFGINDLINGFVEKGVAKIERPKEKVGPHYKLQFWIKIDRARPDKYGDQLPQQAVSAKKVAEDPAAVSEEKVQAITNEGEGAGATEAAVSEPTATPGKIRPIEQEQLKKAEAENEPAIPLVQESSKQLSLLNVTEQVPQEKPVEAAEDLLSPPAENHDGEVSQEVKKSDVKLKHTVSMDADRITKDLDSNKELGTAEVAKPAYSIRKLAIIIVVALILIYFLFLRGSAPADEPSTKTTKGGKSKRGKPGKGKKKSKE